MLFFYFYSFIYIYEYVTGRIFTYSYILYMYFLTICLLKWKNSPEDLQREFSISIRYHFGSMRYLLYVIFVLFLSLYDFAILSFEFKSQNSSSIADGSLKWACALDRTNALRLNPVFEDLQDSKFRTQISPETRSYPVSSLSGNSIFLWNLMRRERKESLDRALLWFSPLSK